jgi:F420-0:gamma-glutamyl ligase
LTVRDGLYTANAGIDESNGNGRLVLLPKDCFQSANAIRRKLLRHYKIKNLGVIITDSRTLPLRAGVLGIALGYAGIKGLRDYRGQKDIFGRKFKFAKTDVADSLATAATLEMGEGSERQPLALISQASVKFVNRTNTKELLINPKDDMFIPLLPGRFD